MKLLISILAFLNGAYMLLDGVYVMLNDKYIGPEKPGPWASIFRHLDIDVFKLGPLFITFGLLWLSWLISFWTRQSWVYSSGIIICLLTLWYLPVGTLFSIVILLALVFLRDSILT